jgi:hypothetical protein
MLWSDTTDVSACDCGTAIDDMQATPAVHPVQLPRGGSGNVSAELAFTAYEVYCHLYGPQEAMVTGGCRGGFGVGELVAYLYAKTFPKKEWRQRADYAIENQRIDRG